MDLASGSDGIHEKVICPGRSKQYLLNHTNTMRLHYYTQGCDRLYILYMIFVGKNKRIVLKMLTASSKNTNTMQEILSRNI